MKGQPANYVVILLKSTMELDQYDEVESNVEVVDNTKCEVSSARSFWDQHRQNSYVNSDVRRPKCCGTIWVLDAS